MQNGLSIGIRMYNLTISLISKVLVSWFVSWKLRRLGQTKTDVTLLLSPLLYMSGLDVKNHETRKQKPASSTRMNNSAFRPYRQTICASVSCAQG